MDESPIAKLVEHATAAHAAVTAQREAAKAIAQQVHSLATEQTQTQGQAGDAAPY
jgi:hypothetical protein